MAALPVPKVVGSTTVTACHPRSTRPSSATSRPWKNGAPAPDTDPTYGVATFVHPDPVVRYTTTSPADPSAWVRLTHEAYSVVLPALGSDASDRKLSLRKLVPGMGSIRSATGPMG